MPTFYGSLRIGGVVPAPAAARLAALIADFGYWGPAGSDDGRFPDAAAISTALARAASAGQQFECVRMHDPGDGDEPEFDRLAGELQKLGITARIALEGAGETGRLTIRTHPELRTAAFLQNSGINGKDWLAIEDAWDHNERDPADLTRFLGILNKAIPAIAIAGPAPAPAAAPISSEGPGFS